MATAIKVKNHFSPSERVLSPKGIKPAKQEFKDDADLNSIMKKFQKTGAIDHAKIHQGRYGFATGQTLHEAATIVANANSMFEDLPSSIRNKFENEPARFLDYVQDANNWKEARELGISLAPEVIEQAKALEEQSKAGEPAAIGGEAGQEVQQAAETVPT